MKVKDQMATSIQQATQAGLTGERPKANEILKANKAKLEAQKAPQAKGGGDEEPIEYEPTQPTEPVTEEPTVEPIKGKGEEVITAEPTPEPEAVYGPVDNFDILIYPFNNWV